MSRSHPQLSTLWNESCFEWRSELTQGVTDLGISPYFDAPSSYSEPGSSRLKEKKKGSIMAGFGGTNGKVFDDDPRLKRLHEYVEECYSEHIPLEKAARVAALESSYFSSYFRAKVGINFTDWLRQVRIRKAMALMKSRDFAITEVAEEVGFRDLRTFERAFKKYTLTTPREFKKSVVPV